VSLLLLVTRKKDAIIQKITEKGLINFLILNKAQEQTGFEDMMNESDYVEPPRPEPAVKLAKLKVKNQNTK